VSTDEKPIREDETPSNEIDEVKKTDMTADELARLRAELRLRQKAAMVCSAVLLLNINCLF